MREDGQKRKPYTVLLEEQLRLRIAEVVYWTPGLSVADFMEQAVIRELRHHKPAKGAKFQPIPGQLKRGKPMKFKG